jgi:hypothetical protein
MHVRITSIEERLAAERTDSSMGFPSPKADARLKAIEDRLQESGNLDARADSLQAAVTEISRELEVLRTKRHPSGGEQAAALKEADAAIKESVNSDLEERAAAFNEQIAIDIEQNIYDCIDRLGTNISELQTAKQSPCNTAFAQDGKLSRKNSGKMEAVILSQSWKPAQAAGAAKNKHDVPMLSQSEQAVQAEIAAENRQEVAELSPGEEVAQAVVVAESRQEAAMLSQSEKAVVAVVATENHHSVAELSQSEKAAMAAAVAENCQKTIEVSQPEKIVQVVAAVEPRQEVAMLSPLQNNDRGLRAEGVDDDNSGMWSLLAENLSIGI